jgi:hypothetical protein
MTRFFARLLPWTRPARRGLLVPAAVSVAIVGAAAVASRLGVLRTPRAAAGGQPEPASMVWEG